MRQKVAKAIRKSLNYHPRNDREYKTFELETRRKPTAQYNLDTGEINVVMRSGTSFITECISGDRKFYKYMKRKYMNFEHEEILTPLPDDSELNEIAKQAKEDFAKEKSNE